MTDKRAIAGKWREALQIETLFNTPEQIYERLQSVGCTRGFQAVRSWIFDEDMIAPQSKQDLENIAAITGNDVLKEMLDQIYSAAQAVNGRSSNGIVVGPEFSRMIAEILLERIDNEVLLLLSNQGLRWHKDYEVFRYVDDIFVFSNEQKNIDLIIDSYSHIGEKYRLRLNELKLVMEMFRTEEMSSAFKDMGRSSKEPVRFSLLFIVLFLSLLMEDALEKVNMRAS